MVYELDVVVNEFGLRMYNVCIWPVWCIWARAPFILYYRSLLYITDFSIGHMASLHEPVNSKGVLSLDHQKHRRDILEICISVISYRLTVVGVSHRFKE